MAEVRASISDRIYRGLLRLLPFDFRSEFESDMEQVFREQLARESRRGRIGLLRLWWETIAGIFHTAPREHLSILAQDVRYALRMLRKNPGYAAVAVLTLALGIGANTAIMSVISAVLLRPLPYENDRQIVVLHQTANRGASGEGIEDVAFSVPEINDYREQSSSFSSLVEYHSMRFTLFSKDEATRVRAGVVSPGFFRMFGVKPLMGRDFVEADDRPGAPAVLLLSYEYWKQHGGDPNIVGRTFEMNDRVHTVIGVLPPVPQYPNENDVYMPTSACPFRGSPAMQGNRGGHMMSLFGRLKPGVTAEKSQADLRMVASRLASDYPKSYPKEGGFTASDGLLREELTRRARVTLWVLLAAAGCVLLIACANVANLTLARMSARQRELSVRAALGAGKGRLLRQLGTESLILGVLAAGLGFLFASQSLRLLAAFTARLTSRAREIQIDWTMLVFALAVAIGTSIVFGTISALYSRDDLGAGMKDGAVNSTAGRKRSRARSMLVVWQVAFSLVLLIGAGLMLRSLIKLQQVDPGFVPNRVLALTVDLNWSKYPTRQQVRSFSDRLLAKIESQPGVLSAALSSSYPLDPDNTGGGWGGRFQIEGRPLREGEASPITSLRSTTPDYFKTLGMRLIQGRTFTAEDRDKSPLVVVINQSMARHYWKTEDPIGRRVSFDQGGQLGQDHRDCRRRARVRAGPAARRRSLLRQRPNSQRGQPPGADRSRPAGARNAIAPGGDGDRPADRHTQRRNAGAGAAQCRSVAASPGGLAGHFRGAGSDHRGGRRGRHAGAGGKSALERNRNSRRTGRQTARHRRHDSAAGHGTRAGRPGAGRAFGARTHAPDENAVVRSAADRPRHLRGRIRRPGKRRAGGVLPAGAPGAAD